MGLRTRCPWNRALILMMEEDSSQMIVKIGAVRSGCVLFLLLRHSAADLQES